MYKIGLISDIKQAFLNVGVSGEHRDFLRFLWREGDDETLIVYRFLRVVFGINSSPFLLNGTILHHMKNYLMNWKELVEKFLRDLYVDDSTVGVSSVEEGVEFYEFSKQSMSEGGFHLRKWFSNSYELMHVTQAKEGVVDEGVADSYTQSLFAERGSSELNSKKVLGVMWNGETDKLVFDFDDMVEEALSLPATKRNLLRIGSKFYDSLGLISPNVIATKVLFQKLCEDKLDWDSEIPPDLAQKWFNYLNELNNVIVSIPRFCFRNMSVAAVTNITLHGFSDSSERAYCAVIYAQVKNNDSYVSNIIASKTKVTPLKRLSIPRLELLACLLLVNLMETVCSALKEVFVIAEKYFWTDSEISLAWIKNSSKEWKSWVEHRVNKIRDLSNKDGWNHVPGSLDPADIPTRDININDFNNNLLRWCGPEFLQTGDLPKIKDNIEINTTREDINIELKPVLH